MADSNKRDNAFEEGVSWWRVSFDRREGSVKSCEAIEAVQTKNSVVGYVYVQANDKVGAIRKATEWLDRRRESTRRATQKMTERRLAAGICLKCKAPASSGHQLCEQHLAWKRDANLRLRGGTAAPIAPVDPIRSMLNTKDRLRGYARQQMHLPKVLLQFDELGPVAFRTWLVNEIARREGGPTIVPEVEAEAAE